MIVREQNTIRRPLPDYEIPDPDYLAMGFRLVLTLTTLTIILMPGLLSEGTDLWVDRNSLGGPCDDGRSRSAVTKSTPWCTISALRDILLPGDVVHVRAGEYTEVFSGCTLCWDQAVLQVVVSGTAENPIKIMAEPGEDVLLSNAGGAGWGILLHGEWVPPPRYVEIEGFKVTGHPQACVLVWMTSDVVLKGLEVYGCPDQAMEFHYTSRITIDGCDVHDNDLGWTSPIDLKLCNDGHIVRGNRVWNNTDDDPRDTEGHGVIMDTCLGNGGAVIENNLIWDNEGYCINIYDSDGATVRNNTCYQNGLGRYRNGELAVIGNYARIHNNILIPRVGAPGLLIHDYPPPPIDFSTITSDYNIIWSPDHDQVVQWPTWNEGTLAEYQASNDYGWDQNSIQIDPLLSNPSATYFSLAYGSPAIDSGSVMFGAPIDANGFPRPLDGNGDGTAVTDRGAYEYAGIFQDSFESAGVDRWSGVSP